MINNKIFCKMAVKCVVIAALILSIVAFAILTYSDNLQYKPDVSPDVALQNTAYANNKPNQYNSNFGLLAHGSTYTFTDSTKVSGYRSGSQTTDLTTVTVNGAADHGSQANPFVIDSTTRWSSFASLTATDTSANTLNKCFVLTADLTFSNNFTSINYFYGSFYGLNHTLSGVTGSSTRENFGVFCVLDGTGTITDLSVNYNWSQTGDHSGGLIGRIHGSVCNILNCHTNGTATRTTRNAPCYWGGIVGHIGESSLTSLSSTAEQTTIYRCSAKSTVTFTENSSVFLIGGLIGCGNNDMTLNLWDCYFTTDMTLKVTSPTNVTSLGGAIGCIASPGRTVSIENIVGRCNIGATNNITISTQPTWLYGSVFSLKAEKFKTTLSVKNTYIYAYGYNASTGKTAYARAVLYQNGSQNINYLSDSASNINIATVGDGGVWQGVLDSANPTNGWYLPNYAVNCTKHTTTAALWSAVNNAALIPSKIWTNKSAINDTYSYTTANSPVRNNNIKTSGFTINYYNRKSNANQAVSGASSTTYNPASLGAGITLANPVMTGRSFAGWTTDLTGNSATIDKITSAQGFYGDINLYAVWDALNAYGGTSVVSADISATSETTVRHENGTNKYSVDYGSTLQLTGSVDYLNMTDESVSYRWVKGSDAKSSNAQINLSQVADSGAYQLQYKVVSASEPLWRSPDWMAAADVEVEIKGADVYLRRFALNTGVKAYVGMTLGDLQCAVEIEDEGGRTVNGTYEWEGGATATIDEADVYEDTDGKLKYDKNLILKPTGGNYGNTTVKVTLDVEYLYIQFNMAGVQDPLLLRATYGQNYTNAQIAFEFEQAFLKAMEENGGAYTLVKDKVPYFDGEIISDYRAKDVNNVIKATKVIAVTFNDVEYTVTFNYTNTGGVQTLTEKYKYGQNLKSPVINLAAGHMVFGWNFEAKDTTGATQTRYWRFVATEDDPIDYVTEDVELTADIREVTLTLLRLEVVQHNKTFEALSTLSAKDVTVYAIYDISPKVEGMDEYKQAIAEGTGGYTIDYHNGRGVNLT